MDIDVKQAVRIAKTFLTEMAEDSGGVANVWVEEVRRSGGTWLITLSHAHPFETGRTVFKIFCIDAETGEVISMATPGDWTS